MPPKARPLRGLRESSRKVRSERKAAVGNAVNHTPVERPVKRVLDETEHPSSQLIGLLAAIWHEKRSGRLEIHFNQGSPNGTVKFTERRD